MSKKFWKDPLGKEEREKELKVSFSTPGFHFWRCIFMWNSWSAQVIRMMGFGAKTVKVCSQLTGLGDQETQCWHLFGSSMETNEGLEEFVLNLWKWRIQDGKDIFGFCIGLSFIGVDFALMNWSKRADEFWFVLLRKCNCVLILL